MNPINFKATVDESGEKTLDVNVYGVIGGGWFDAETVSAAEVAKQLQEHKDAKSINVHINSVGGSLYDGVAIYNLLNGHDGDVTCIVEGMAASAASIIAMAGKTVMGRGSMLMIHNPMVLAAGNATELRRVAADLDKMQASLLSIYRSKTKKKGAELKAMLAAETYLTPDQAKRQGFADEIAADVADDDVTAPEARGDLVIWNGVAFPRTSLPREIFMSAKTPTPPGTATQTPPAPAPVVALVPAPAAQPPITRAELVNRAPELLAELLKEGATSERSRIQAIDELGLKGCDEMVVAAKYSDKPMDAPALAVAAIKAGHQAGAELLAARRKESGPITAVAPTSPEREPAAEEARAIKAIVDGGNARRGGVVR